jgi:hypothetical protein
VNRRDLCVRSLAEEPAATTAADISVVSSCFMLYGADGARLELTGEASIEARVGVGIGCSARMEEGVRINYCTF